MHQPSVAGMQEVRVELSLGSLGFLDVARCVLIRTWRCSLSAALSATVLQRPSVAVRSSRPPAGSPPQIPGLDSALSQMEAASETVDGGVQARLYTG